MGNMFALERGTGKILLVDGSATVPSLTFASNQSIGIWNAGSNTIDIGGTSVNASVRFRGSDGIFVSIGSGGADGHWTFMRGTGAAGSFSLICAVDNGPNIGGRNFNRPGNIYTAGLICAGSTLVQNCQFLATTCVALTIRNGANTGTLTNSPTTGNPEVWAQVNNNGCTYVVPLWRLT